MEELRKIVEFFAKEGQVILQAPVTFLICVLIVAGIAWGVLSWRYSGQIENLNSQVTTLQGQLKTSSDNYEDRLKLKDDQIADYKNKLSGATPDEAKARIDELERQIIALSPRRLTQEQKAAISQKLSSIRGTIAITQDMAVADARGLANDLKFVFQSSGWRVQSPMAMGLGNPPPTGIGLHVSDQNALKPIEATVKSALEAAGLDFDIQGGFRSPPVGQPTDVELLITSRLN